MPKVKTPPNRTNVLINYNDSHWTFAMFINGIYKTQSGFVVPKDVVNKFYYIAQVVQAIQEQEAIRLSLN